MALKINPMHPVRGIQAVFAIIVLGLMAYVSTWWTSHWLQACPAQISFLVFVPVFTLLALLPIFLIPLRFSHLLSSAAIRWGLIALDGLTMVFWFAGFVALAVFLDGRICFGRVCDIARAGTVFGGLSWAVAAGAFAYGMYLMVRVGKGRVPAVQKPDVVMHQGV